MEITLDTSALVDLLRGHARLRDLLDSLEANGHTPVVSSIAAFELLSGAELSGSRTERSRLRNLLSRFEIQPFDATAAGRAAELRAELRRVGRTPGLPDVLIAGQALANAQLLVTRDRLLAESAQALGVDVRTY